mgnify:CR=1 FL=1
METNNQIMLLRDYATEPTEQVLKNTLGEESFAIYQELLDMITDEFGLEYEWRYYKDGKAWLFKGVHKKKTIFWLSAWEGFIKTNFIFTEKTRSGISDLPISNEIKETFDKAPLTGKFVSLILDIKQKEQLNDFREIALFKKKLK